MSAPGPTATTTARSPDLVAREAALESGVFTKRPIQIVRGQGSLLYDADGREYLDAGASYGTNHVGHRHPHVLAALQAQMDRLLHIPSTYGNDTRLRFFEALRPMVPAPLARAFLASTGTEAIECAIKFARQATGRPGIVSLQRAFHGRTLGALSATAKAEYRKPFEPLVPGFSRIAPEDEEALKAAITTETAAFLFEPVQGEGGIVPLSDRYLRAARDIAHDKGALLIADEVQTGLGRAGRFLACEASGVVPDLVALGKGIGGGVPLSVTLATDEVAIKQAKASHGNTFGGNPLACAAGVAVLEVIRSQRLVARSAEVGARLLSALAPLADFPGVRAVRGKGLMLGVELSGKPFPVLDAMVARGVLALPAGATVVRLLPPLVLSAAVTECVRAHASRGEAAA